MCVYIYIYMCICTSCTSGAIKNVCIISFPGYRGRTIQKLEGKTLHCGPFGVREKRGCAHFQEMCILLKKIFSGNVHPNHATTTLYDMFVKCFIKSSLRACSCHCRTGQHASRAEVDEALGQKAIKTRWTVRFVRRLTCCVDGTHNPSPALAVQPLGIITSLVVSPPVDLSLMFFLFITHSCSAL